jgi:large subunit ribosomal protein L29
MKRKEFLELREHKVEELQAKVRDLREELFKLNLQRHGGQIEKTSRLNELRRDIARTLTLINQKQRPVLASKGGAPAAQAAK